MTLSELSLRRPVLAIVANILIVVAGIAALFSLPIRELPDVDTAQVTVSVTYEGAAPEVIDAEVTAVVEGAISGVSGIRSIASESERGSSRTVIEFEPDVDIDTAANDVRSEVSRIVGDLPEEAEEPEVEKSDSEDDPVIRLSMISERLSAAELTDYADRYIVDQLATIAGVADVVIEGEQPYAMRVWLDQRAMAARSVTVEDITAALERNNLELPAGEIETASRQFQVRTETRFASAEALGDLIVRSSPTYPIRLREVADVVLGVESDDTAFRSDFRTAIGLGVLRQSQANTVAISQQVQASLASLSESLPTGTTLSVASDDAVFIEASIHEVVITLVEAIVLVIAVIYVFLASLRATVVPALTIPISLVGACAGLALLGFSLNILTLFAMILAIGLVVDDAIIVLENIQRRIERGEDALTASALGSKQVTFAVIATSATLIAVFVPISFLQGQVGRLFTEFGLALAVAVLISMFVALTLCPLLCARLLKDNSEPGRFERFVNAILNSINGVYRHALVGALRVPYLVVGVATFIGASSFAIYERLPSELTPSEDRGTFFINIEGPQGANLAYTDRVVADVEAILAPFRESELITNVSSIIGRYGELQNAFVIVRLADWDERDRTQAEIIAEIEPLLEAVTAADIRTGSPAGLGLRGSNNPLRVVVGGPEFVDVEAWAATLHARMNENEGLRNVESDYEANQPGYRIELDRERVRDIGIDAATISETLQTLFASTEVTEYTDRGRQYPVLVQARDADRANPQDIAESFVRTDAGQLVPLDGLVTIEALAAPRALNRYDRLPSIELSAGLAGDYDLGAAIAFVTQAAAAELPPEATISFEGQAREFQDTSSGVLLVFGLAIVIVFLVLAAQFESFIHPLIVMLTVPLGIAGALITLLLTGQTLNVYNQVGLVLLIGLMAKNGILIVEFANQLRDEGRSVRDAVLEASVVRLRPILMTVLATLLGAVPLALSTGAGAESRIAIGLVILGGFSVASVLTLFVVPALYLLLAPLTRPKGEAADKLRKALDGAEVEGDAASPAPGPA